MKSIGDVQRALTKGPGSASAAALWTVRAGQTDNAVRAAAVLLKTAEALQQPGNLYLVVGLSPRLLARSECAREAEGAVSLGNDAQEESVFVQVAAQTHVDRLFGLRLIDAALSGTFDRRWEMLGDKILHGMEGFGFQDGEAPAWANMDAPERGMWLMQQRFDYLIGPFFQLGGAPGGREGRQRARAEVIGRPPGVVVSDADKVPGAPTERAAIEAHIANLPPAQQGRRPHWHLMKEAKVDTLLRRGFPFRHDGVEGLMFLAASLRAADLSTARDVFNARDKLAEHVQGKVPGLFFCPNNAELLMPSGAAIEALAIPPTAEVLEHGPDLEDYTVSVADMRYMKAFVFDGNALHPEPLREQVKPTIRALFQKMHTDLAVGNAEQFQQLEALLDTFHETSRQINRIVGTYITKG